MEHQRRKGPGGSVHDKSANDLGWVLGLKVRVQTVMDDTYTGTMYAYCPITNSITLLEGSNDFRVLKSAFVSQLQVLEKDSSAGKGHENGRFSRAEPLIASVNMSSLVRKEGKKSVNGLAPPAKGVGVTKEAQDIFDALSRTLPCRWAAKSIIVLDVVRVDEPYTVDACRAPENSTSALHRVRKVLDGERRRLFPAKAPAERKGG